MTNERFTESAPASDIHELRRYLDDTADAKHVYRGQTKHYASLVPSAYRLATEAGHLQKAMVPIDASFTHKPLGEREAIRLRKLGGLVRTYGLGLGNIVAQQYGITSECLDVTTNPTVAAFFATRRYAHYTHWNGSSDNRVGVIYRFTVIDFVSDLDALDMTLEWAGMSVGGRPVWFMKRLKRRDLSPSEIANLLGTRDHGRERLFTHPAVVSHDLFRACIEQRYEERNAQALANQPPGQKPVVLTAHKRLDDTRMIRQRGGFLLPSCVWDCTVPREVEIEYFPHLKNDFFNPGYAIAEQLVAVENLCQYPRLESFFFRHSAKEVSEVSREYLWPGPEEDDWYRWISLLASMGSEEYLARHECEVDDKDRGIVDRGYYEAQA